jgi:hypothetical protein
MRQVRGTALDYRDAMLHFSGFSRDHRRRRLTRAASGRRTKNGGRVFVMTTALHPVL